MEFTREDTESALSSSTEGNHTPRVQDRPTTDPIRIYRRCCQLRETPVLKIVVEQISSAPAAVAEAPGTVPILNLSNHILHLSDITTLSDWLAVVPVRKLMLENCGLTDEAVRIVLAGLLATKTVDQVKYNKNLVRVAGSTDASEEKLGVIEKLSLKGNPKIGREGWRHIGLFIHMSKSLKGINLSHNPIPQLPSPPLTSPHGHGPGHLLRTNSSTVPPPPISSLVARALAQRFAGKGLEEVIMDDCSLTALDIGHIVDGVLAAGSKRLGLASNNIDEDGFAHVARYIASGQCEGIDLAGNDMRDHMEVLAESLGPDNPLQALSLGYCGLTPFCLERVLESFTRLPDFRFVDLSHNPGLFESTPNAVSQLRKYLPRMPELRRIHLADVNMSPEHAISLSEVFPECPILCHITLLENERLMRLAAATDPATQEESCALYASLMTAVRVSRTIIAIEIEVPNADSHEVIKALASQIVAYGLRNLEQGPFSEAYPEAVSSKTANGGVPEILLHLVGHIEGYDVNCDDDEPAPDEDYVIGGSGVVKALGICLESDEQGVRRGSRDSSPAPSGAAAPRKLSAVSMPQSKNKKPRDMAIQLLDSARKIRMRLRPALIREDRAGNDVQWRRLFFLDSTLLRMIQRFEDEYPEFRQTTTPPSNAQTASEVESVTSSIEGSTLIANDNNSPSASLDNPQIEIDDQLEDERDGFAVRLSRTPSSTSLAARALTFEEGRMHRFGQQVRRDLLRPQTLDHAHGTTDFDPPEPSHLNAIRMKIEMLRGDEIRERVEKDGADHVLEQMGANAAELLLLAREDPEAFERFRDSQVAAEINSNRIAAASATAAASSENE